MPGAAYGYLGASLIATAAVAIVLVGVRRGRGAALWAGGLSGSLGFCAFVLEGDYWRPTRLGGGPWGAEDVLMGFAAGAGTWVLARTASPLHVPARGPRPAHLPTRLLGPLATGVLVLLGAWSAGLPPMSAYLALLGAGALVLLAWRPALWRLALAGGLAFLLVWIALAHLAFGLWPAFELAWNGARPWGRPLLGVPTGEWAWAFAFGATWPLYVAFLFDASPAPPARLARPALEVDRAASSPTAPGPRSYGGACRAPARREDPR